MSPVPAMKKEGRPFHREMLAALKARHQIAGQAFHLLQHEDFDSPTADALRCRFWLGNDQHASATYTFTFSSDLSVTDNLSELEDFVNSRLGTATMPPV